LVSAAGEPVDAAEQDGEAEARDKEGGNQRRGGVVEEEEAAAASDGRRARQPGEHDQVAARRPAEADDEQRRREEQEEQEEDVDQRLQETGAGDERRQDPGRTVLTHAAGLVRRRDFLAF